MEQREGATTKAQKEGRIPTKFFKAMIEGPRLEEEDQKTKAVSLISQEEFRSM